MEDALELIGSGVLSTSTLTTWAYYDARNLESADGFACYEDFTPVLNFPVPDVVNPDGTEPEEKETRSQYWKFDKTTDRMTVQQTLSTEANGDDSQTLIDYLEVALSDCVEQGSDEYMLIMSSHGGGYSGFGGDDHPGRHLAQANVNIVDAIQTTLALIDGAPAQLDVLGFDACLMMSLGALDDYHTITKYYMASEAIEPGHGWSYGSLSQADTALGIARELQQSFLNDQQGDEHITPKTLAIVDTSMFSAFLEAWESLMAYWSEVHASDAGFVTLLRRSRGSSAAFVGGYDDVTNTYPSALDIGHFLSTFKFVCKPKIDTELIAVETAYTNMFVERGVGPGTNLLATGMHVYWPTRKYFSEILSQTPLHRDEIFHGPSSTATAPNFLAFLPNILRRGRAFRLWDFNLCFIRPPG